MIFLGSKQGNLQRERYTIFNIEKKNKSEAIYVQDLVICHLFIVQFHSYKIIIIKFYIGSCNIKN